MQKMQRKNKKKKNDKIKANFFSSAEDKLYYNLLGFVYDG